MATPYAVTAKASEIRERFALLIERDTPELLPSFAFKRHTGYERIEVSTNIKRLRSFRVRCANFIPGEYNDGQSLLDYTGEFEVHMGYIRDPFLAVSGIQYDMQDLMVHDFEQIDKLFRLGAPFASQDAENPEIQNVQIADLLSSVFIERSMIRVTSFSVKYSREFA